MSASEYLLGIALLAVVLGGFGLSAVALKRVLVETWTGAPAVLATIVLAISVAILTGEVLGAIGLLSTPGLLAGSVLPALALTWWRPGPVRSSAPPAAAVGRVAFAIAIAAALLTAVHWAGPVLKSLDVGMYRQDSLWYHLPTAAWFAQTGSIDGLLFTDPLKLTVWFYPANSELLHSFGMVVLDNDLLSPLLNFGWMAVALLSAWCIGRPFGLAATTLLGGVLVVGSDMMLVQAGNAPSDIVALACLLAAIAILANGTDRGALAIAALAAGLAIGSKMTMLVPVGVITIAVLAAGRRDFWPRAGTWFGGLLATGSFWYLRNLIHSGNPLPWVDAGPLPGPSQDELYPRPAHSVAEYLADRHAWTEFFFPGLGETLGPLWPVVVFAAFAGVVLGLRRRQPRPLRVLAVAAAVTLVAYVFIPISGLGAEGAPSGFASNLRYAAPFFAIGLVILPLCETRTMARRVIGPAYAVLVAIAAIGSAEWVQPQLLSALAIGAAAVLLPVWLLRQPAPAGRLLVVPAVAVLALLAGYAQQRQYFEDRYQTAVAPPLDNPGFRATDQWQAVQTWALGQHDVKIGIVGTPAAYGQYIFYGDDLSNTVRYLGEQRPHGGFGPIDSCSMWGRRLLGGEFEAVVITPEDPGQALLPVQIAWTGVTGAALPAVQVPPAGVYLITAAPDARLCAPLRGGSEGLNPGGYFGPQIPSSQFEGAFPEEAPAPGSP